MRTRIYAGLVSVFLCLAVLLFSPSVNPETFAKANARPNRSMTAANIPAALAKTPTGPKPLAVWECVTGWYGEPFDGQLTANGEIYDMYAATAAHPTLPLGSIVRVVNERNHRSEIVRINDRGPYVEGRELDVSYGVARDLGFDQTGLAKVEVELLKVPPRPVPDHRN
ncbi:MAG TPA: septal ring lytic transglycosylase RlpA family protein [Candidatus Acidoferrales bacterium]|nr:septal ring lytic transglycosylase RlpA family protein [Candidatus Acidoferrales bacterium]